MELTHRFTVPVPVEEAWEHFDDISSVAECFPGASVTSADSDSFAGSVKVKLGPIALVYNGSGTFTDKDEAAHRMVVDAKGKDKRGNGTAGALVTMTMTESMADAGSTDIEVLTDLSITGKPAQFGRGVIQDVSDKLLGQFVACLEQRLAAQPLVEEGTPPLVEDGRQGPLVPEEPRDEASRRARDPANHEPASPTPPAAEPDPTLTDEAAPAAVEAPPPMAPTPTNAKKDDSLDLGAAVMPVLVRSYWKHALAALVVIILVVWLIAAL